MIERLGQSWLSFVKVVDWWWKQRTHQDGVDRCLGRELVAGQNRAVVTRFGQKPEDALFDPNPGGGELQRLTEVYQHDGLLFTPGDAFTYSVDDSVDRVPRDLHGHPELAPCFTKSTAQSVIVQAGNCIGPFDDLLNLFSQVGNIVHDTGHHTCKI